MALAPVLLLALLVLLVQVVTTSPAQATSPVPCQPVTDVTLGYTPSLVYPGTPVLFGAAVITESLPITHTWDFGDGTLPVTGTTTLPVLTATHAFTAIQTYTVALTTRNTCSQWVSTTTVPIVGLPARTLLPLVVLDTDPLPAAHLGYGANIASADHVISMTAMGFDWAKGFVTWRDAGSGPAYDWTAVDNQLREFAPEVQHVLLRLGGPPPSGIGNPPTSTGDLAAFHDFALALATHISSTWRIQGLETAAYEIWNEPNLDYEWGGQPSAAQYTALLQAGYEGIKAGDPQAIVVSAGMATTGGSAADLALARQLYGASQVIPDLTFLRNMYENGAKGYFDALGSHPYGGRDAPDTPPGSASGPIYFRRAEEQHQVMLDYGDESPVWATEFGWVLTTDCHLGEHEWMEVSEAQQGEYLAGAYAYADENWPWMGPMFLFDLDFGAVTWYAECDPVRWYSITYRENPYDPGHSPVLPRQAFFSLREMAKRSAW